MPTAMAEGVSFISRALEGGGSILVHCHRGISRSITITMAWMVQELQLPSEEAFAKIKHARRCADPNLGFWCCLKEWEARVLVKPPRSLKSLSPRTGAPSSWQ